MRILIIGGTGLVGGHAALRLKSEGHQVVIAGRNAPPSTVPDLSGLDFIQGDFAAGGFDAATLAGFDAIVFAAGSDIRHVPAGRDPDEHFLHTNGTVVPEFARLAKSAGVQHFIHIGSFYPHIAPELVESVPYVRSRKLAADGVIALSSGTFRACSLDAPFVVGFVSGMQSPMFEAYIKYAKGELPIPPFAPMGGTNFISTQAISTAISVALANSLGGKALVLGEENFSFKEYFEMFFRAVGNETDLPVLDQDHPLMPRATLYTGTRMVSYEDPEDVEAALGQYNQNSIYRTIQDIVQNHARA